MPLSVHLEGLPSPGPSLECWDHFLAFVGQQERGFFQVIDDDREWEACRQALAGLPKTKHFVHLGIGGSSLGAQTLISSLAGRRRKDFTFIDNIDPDALARQLDGIDLADSLIYAVSKSGQTAETLACLSVLGRQPGRLLFATGASGTLRESARAFAIPCLTIPAEVGGRYSALSTVGLLPTLWAGIDGAALLRGARAMKSALQRPLLDCASAILGLHSQGVSQTVLMPYSGCLREVGHWFVQLWAESLGKKLDTAGRTVHQGLTPLAACGVTDQHSQMQLFMEGPADKLLIIVEVESFDRDYKLAPPPEQFRGRRLSELFKAELYGTLQALQEAGRPYIRIRLDGHDPGSLGELIFFLSCLTVLVGLNLGVNPFDQPGVERAKRYTWRWPTSPPVEKGPPGD